jgi:hypothetical protein
MDVDRRVKRLRAFQDRPEKFVVEIATAHMAVDHRALERAGTHALLQFRRRLVRHHGR